MEPQQSDRSNFQRLDKEEGSRQSSLMKRRYSSGEHDHSPDVNHAVFKRHRHLSLLARCALDVEQLESEQSEGEPSEQSNEVGVGADEKYSDTSLSDEEEQAPTEDFNRMDGRNNQARGAAINEEVALAGVPMQTVAHTARKSLPLYGAAHNYCWQANSGHVVLQAIQNQLQSANQSQHSAISSAFNNNINFQNGTMNRLPGSIPHEMLNHAMIKNMLESKLTTAQENPFYAHKFLMNSFQTNAFQHSITTYNNYCQQSLQRVQNRQDTSAWNGPSSLVAPVVANPFGTQQRGGNVGGIVAQASVQKKNPLNAFEVNHGAINLNIPGQNTNAQEVDPSVRCMPVWSQHDKQRLSTQQCWLRRQLETFPASEKDVRRHARGRNRQLALGQVGIQCIHCKHISQEGRGKGSSYFPSSTASMYQSAQNILSNHFKENTCPLIPRRLLLEMKNAGEEDKVSPEMVPKAGKSRAGGGKRFWTECAAAMGLFDTISGIRYADDVQNYQTPQPFTLLGKVEDLPRHDVKNSGEPPKNILSVLIEPSDRGTVTDFCFLLMSLYQPYCSRNFDASNGCGARKVKSFPTNQFSYKELAPNIDNEESGGQQSIGIACRFCMSAASRESNSSEEIQCGGIFLSFKASTISRNKSLAKLHGHVMSCSYVPDDIKNDLVHAKDVHLPQSQSNQLKKGWKKIFFENVVDRLKRHLEKES